jgi:YHS domain-containing protein
MGGKIDSSAYSNIQGQRVYHCCNGCQKKLAADPDKYFKQAAKDGILFENIQKRCPVSGKAIENKEVYVDYEGRRIFFSDKECATKFAAEPLKYLKVLDQQTQEDFPAKHEKSSGHGDHM